LNKGKNGIDFSSYIDNAKKSLAKLMDHRIEKLSALLDANQTQLNLTNIISDIPIEREYELNEASENNPCSSANKVKPLSMPKSKRLKIEKYSCETCKKTFKTSTELNIHNRIHSKQKPFACEQCQMTFSQIGSLNRHKKVHSGEKPYSCDFCPKKFARSHHLICHKRMHSGEKPYQCDVCPMKFARSDCLTNHKRTHTGERPYQCDICPMKFTQLTNLIRHKRIHT
jgi:uncharacterized Zn-finger protein